MRRHRLTRFDATKDGTLGRFEQWRTLEEEDQGNRRNVSSIPAGTYIVKRVDSPRFGDTFEITGVPNRSHILEQCLASIWIKDCATTFSRRMEPVH